MNAAKWVYNGSVLLGLGLCAAGSLMLWGLGVALVLTGGLVLGFTVYAAERLMRRAG